MTHSDNVHARIRANIRAYARRRGKTLVQVADFSGVSVSQLYNYLGDRSDVTVGWLLQVAEGLEVDIHDLTVPIDPGD